VSIIKFLKSIYRISKVYRDIFQNRVFWWQIDELCIRFVVLVTK